MKSPSPWLLAAAATVAVAGIVARAGALNVGPPRPRRQAGHASSLGVSTLAPLDIADPSSESESPYLPQRRRREDPMQYFLSPPPPRRRELVDDQPSAARDGARRMFFASEAASSGGATASPAFSLLSRAAVSESVDRIWTRLYPHLSECQVERLGSPLGHSGTASIGDVQVSVKRMLQRLENHANAKRDATSFELPFFCSLPGQKQKRSTWTASVGSDAEDDTAGDQREVSVTGPPAIRTNRATTVRISPNTDPGSLAEQQAISTPSFLLENLANQMGNVQRHIWRMLSNDQGQKEDAKQQATFGPQSLQSLSTQLAEQMSTVQRKVEGRLSTAFAQLVDQFQEKEELERRDM